MLANQLASTTRTVELTQLAQLEAALEARPAGSPVTAADLDVVGATVEPDGVGEGLPADAVLVALDWEGPPAFPYVYGRFSAGGPDVVVDLHTPALRILSRMLGLRHLWGV